MSDGQTPWQKGADTAAIRVALPRLKITVEAVNRLTAEALMRRYDGRDLDLLTDALAAGAQVTVTATPPPDYEALRRSFGSDTPGAEETLRRLRELEAEVEQLAERPEPGEGADA